MGWKSTVHLGRAEALRLAEARLKTLTDRELGDALEALGFGDTQGLDYYGHNFIVDADEDSYSLYRRLKAKYGDD